MEHGPARAAWGTKAILTNRGSIDLQVLPVPPLELGCRCLFRAYKPRYVLPTQRAHVEVDHGVWAAHGANAMLNAQHESAGEK